MSKFQSLKMKRDFNKPLSKLLKSPFLRKQCRQLKTAPGFIQTTEKPQVFHSTECKNR